jgi:hypothetical protein
VSPKYTEDRSMAGDIREVANMVDTGDFVEYGRNMLPSFN